jgi:hypothetical protein
MESYRKKIAELFASKNTWLWILAGTSFAFLLAYFGSIALAGLQGATGVETYAANGTFQLYNPLRRIAEGQLAGVDFPFFHGIGALWLHVPIFTLLGENVFAAEAAKQLMSPLIFLASSWTFMYAMLRNHKKALIGTALVTLLGVAYINLIEPGNSLIGLRSSLPVFAAAAIIWPAARTRRRELIRHGIIWLLLALSVLCGTEQGVAAIMSYLLVQLFFAVRKKTPLKTIIATLLLSGSGIGVAFLVLAALLTAGSPSGALTYAFVEIPSDQGWYFGTAPNGALMWSNLLPWLFDWGMRYIHLLNIAASVLVFIAWRRKLLTDRHKEVFLFMGLAGVLVAGLGAIGGYYAPGTQLAPLARLSALVLVALGVAWLFSDKTWQWQHKKRFVLARLVPIIGLVACIVLCGLVLKQTIGYIQYARAHDVRYILASAYAARHKTDYEVSGPGWRASLDAFKPYIKPQATVWSTYTSTYDSSLGQVNPSSGGEDYIIHALGKERRENYTSSFIKTAPDYVITLRPTYFPYEEWLWDRHWLMYEHLLSHYTLVKSNNSHFLWERQSVATRQEASQAVEIRAESGRYYLPRNTSDTPAIHTVRVSYTAHSGLHLSTLDKVPRYLLNIRDSSSMQYPVSLPSYETSWEFPVIAMPGNRPYLEQEVHGIIPTANLQVKKVEVSPVATTGKNLALFDDNLCYIRGIRAPEQCPMIEQVLRKTLTP